jgi:hypothetical protein
MIPERMEDLEDPAFLQHLESQTGNKPIDPDQQDFDTDTRVVWKGEANG